MNRDHAICGLFFILGVLICLYSLPYKLGSLASPESGLMPFLSGAGMCVLAVIGFAHATLRNRRKEPRSPLFKGHAWQRSLLTMLALLAFQALMAPLGFALATVLFIGFLLRAIVPQRWPVVVVVSLLTTLLSYMIFEVWLKAQLPKGPWGI